MAWVATTRVSVSQLMVHDFVCSAAPRAASPASFPAFAPFSPASRIWLPALVAVLPSCVMVWLAFCTSAATSGGSQSCEAGAPVGPAAVGPLPAFDMALASREAAVAISFMRFSAPSDWLFHALIFSLKVSKAAPDDCSALSKR